MSDRIQQPLRTFEVRITITYSQSRTVKARTIAGAHAAVRASAEADYPGAEISTHGAQEKGRAER